jgi:hypothetical protein
LSTFSFSLFCISKKSTPSTSSTCTQITGTSTTLEH